jgi:hypothetical protein
MEAFVLAEHQLQAEQIQPDSNVSQSAYFVNGNNELKRIKHSIPLEHSGKSKSQQPVDAVPGLGGQPVTAHREKAHTFADGTEWRCCSATGREWGRPISGKFRVKHNNGVLGGTLYSPDVLDAESDNQSPDDAREIEVPTFGHDTGECEEEAEEVDERTAAEREEDEGYDDEDEELNSTRGERE